MAIKQIHTGDMRFPVRLKQPVTAVNDEGGRTLTYDAGVLTFAAVKEVSQSRGTDGFTVITDSKDFFIRWSADRDLMDKDWLISYMNQDYTINEIEKIGELKHIIRLRGKIRG